MRDDQIMGNHSELKLGSKAGERCGKLLERTFLDMPYRGVRRGKATELTGVMILSSHQSLLFRMEEARRELGSLYIYSSCLTSTFIVN